MSIWDAPSYLRDHLYEQREEQRRLDRQRQDRDETYTWRRDDPRWKIREKQRRKSEMTRFERKKYKWNCPLIAQQRIEHREYLNRDIINRKNYKHTPIRIDMKKRLWPKYVPPSYRPRHPTYNRAIARSAFVKRAYPTTINTRPFVKSNLKRMYPKK